MKALSLQRGRLSILLLAGADMKRFQGWVITLLAGATVATLTGCLWFGQHARKGAAAATVDWTDAVWIGDGKPQPTNDAAFYADDPAPLFRKTFTVTNQVKRARLHIVGLGLYAVRMNGTGLDAGFAPLWTPYYRRVLYDSYSVTEHLQAGENVLSVELGNGWYNPLPMRMWGRFNLREALDVGRPCLIAKLELEHADGSREILASDLSWKVTDGPVLKNSLYLGEVYDARKEAPGWTLAGFDDVAWRPATKVDGPIGNLRAREAPPVGLPESWKAVRVTERVPGTCVVDLGWNFSGRARFRLGEGEAGERITFRYGELLNRNGTVNTMTAVCGQIKRAGMGGPGAPAIAEPCDVYIRKGGCEESYEPRFTWHGFRYVQVEGLKRMLTVDDVAAKRVGSCVKTVSEFACSEPLFKQLHGVCRNTFLSNLIGVQSDCPARERFGYGADIAATTEAMIFNFDMHAFYAKTLQDFEDEAADDGWFTETAPYVGIADRGFGGRSGPIGWTVAVPVLMRDLYRYYGDSDVVVRHYDACVRYVELVKGKCPDLIVPQCIGDHEALEKASESLTATAHFYQWVRLVSEFAPVLGEKRDAKKYDALAGEIRAAFQKKFVVGGKVGQGRQGEQVFGLYHRLVPEADRAAALEILRRDIEAHGGALTTGIFGTKYLLEVLSTEGLEGLAGQLVARREFPSWGYMLDCGATTLWETWKPSDNTYSQNHPMFGSVEEWFMKHALGITVPEDAVGCDRVVIRPKPVAGLTWAKGEYRSVKGPVKVDWKMPGGKMSLSVELPQGVTAKVWLTDEKKWVEVGAGKHAW
jgi:alpha-L-rhamnosidase